MLAPHLVGRLAPPLGEDGGTTRNAFRRVRNPAVLRAIDEALQLRRPGTLRRRTGSSPSVCAFDGAERDSHTGSLEHALSRLPLRDVFRASMTLRGTTRPKLSSFCEPSVACVSTLSTDRFELERPPTTCLAARRGARPRCVRPTSASHCFNYEHPRLVSHQHLFAARAAPLPRQLAPSRKRLVDRAFHDARSASVGPPGFATTACFCRALPFEPNLWHPCRSRAPAFRLVLNAFSSNCLGCALRPSMTIDREPQPGVPSIDRGHPRTRADRYRSREAAS